MKMSLRSVCQGRYPIRHGLHSKRSYISPVRLFIPLFGHYVLVRILTSKLLSCTDLLQFRVLKSHLVEYSSARTGVPPPSSNSNPPRTQSHPHMHAKDRSSKNPPASFTHPPPASSLELASETTSLHYLRHPSHEAAFLCHLHHPCPPSTSEGSLPHRSGIFGSPPFRLRIHAGLDRLLKGV
jgi:hypothetical protein